MKIRIGTRRSKLALAQTALFVQALRERYPGIDIEIVHIATTGDVRTDSPLSELGGRGVFVQEIEKALANGEIDAAIHSAKDLPIQLGEGLTIAAVLKRANPCDCMVTMKAFSREDSLVIGTGSRRRTAAFGRLFPEAQFRDIRGNVDTRLNKLYAGEYDAIILAQAGLERLGLQEDARFQFRTFGTEEVLCAPCQGIIAAECREDSPAAELLQEVNDAATYCCFETERCVLERLGAGCTMPVGALAVCEGDRIRLSVTKDSLHRAEGTAAREKRFELAEELIAQL